MLPRLDRSRKVQGIRQSPASSLTYTLYDKHAARSRSSKIHSDMPPKTRQQIPSISPGTRKKSRMICRKP